MLRLLDVHREMRRKSGSRRLVCVFAGCRVQRRLSSEDTAEQNDEVSTMQTRSSLKRRGMVPRSASHHYMDRHGPEMDDDVHRFSAETERGSRRQAANHQEALQALPSPSRSLADRSSPHLMWSLHAGLALGVAATCQPCALLFAYAQLVRSSHRRLGPLSAWLAAMFDR